MTCLLSYQWLWKSFDWSVHVILTLTCYCSLLCITHGTCEQTHSVVHQPNLVTDMLGAVSSPAYFLSCFSHGYFVHDLMEMLFNLKYKGSGELVFHHLFVSDVIKIYWWLTGYNTCLEKYFPMYASHVFEPDILLLLPVFLFSLLVSDES